MSNFYGSAPTNGTGKWHPEPTFRGTFSILSSCLITMLLCIWTVVHLNIPEHNEKSLIGIRYQTWRKAKWMLVGVFAPEIIAWIAFEQRRLASEIHDTVLERARKVGVGAEEVDDGRASTWAGVSRFWRILCNISRAKPAKFENRHDWTMVHSHYVAMGGFALSLKATDTRFLNSKKYTQFTVTEWGFFHVLDNAPELIPDIPETDIWDRSKASGLAKMIVCLQATWFCVQCIHRPSQSLTISLLELNTFAHALCTLLVYISWWNKPLDVDGTIPLNSSPTNAKEQAAHLLVASMQQPSSLTFKTQRDSSTYRLVEIGHHHPDFLHEERKYVPNKQGPDETYRIPAGRLLDRFTIDGSTMEYDPIKKRYRNVKAPFVDLDETEMTTLRLALMHARGRYFRGQYLALRSHQIPLLLLKKRLVQLASAAAGLCYGSIHLTAWNAPFPNLAQRVFWRMSSLALLAVD